MKVIAIAGLSCSGKTTLARTVASMTGAPILSLDDYYLPLTEYSLAERHKMNFDSPEMYDVPQLLRDLRTLQNGDEVDVPLYDFVEFTRSEETMRLSPSEFLILEGQYALFWPELNAQTELRVFLDVSSDECLRRRVQRDSVQRGRTRAEVQWRFMRHVLPMYERYVSPSRQNAHLVCTHEDVETTLAQVNQALGQNLVTFR